MSARRTAARRAPAGERAGAGAPAAPRAGSSHDDVRRRRALLAWFRREARSLPWRSARDPYRTWVSEVMLQQTQVATVVPYFERFTARYPDARSLARAPLADVLAAWSGLGYYRRARALHAAAGILVREHGGELPADPAAVAALPGVGRYTLGAVMSMGFGARLPVLDGNVARVLARWTARPLQVRRPEDARALWKLAESLLPPEQGRTGEWNEALMELGATVCTPRAPRCGACPVARHCRAHSLGRPRAFPPAAPRRATERVRRAVSWIVRGKRVLMAQRSGSLLSGLWEPPGVELKDGADASRALGAALLALGVRADLRDAGERARHTITHRTIDVAVLRGRVLGALPRRTGLEWVDPDAPDVALTALARRLSRGTRDPRSAPRPRSRGRA